MATSRMFFVGRGLLVGRSRLVVRQQGLAAIHDDFPAHAPCSNGSRRHYYYHSSPPTTADKRLQLQVQARPQMRCFASTTTASNRNSASSSSSSSSSSSTSWDGMTERTRQLANDLLGRFSTSTTNEEDVIKKQTFQRRMALSKAITLVESSEATRQEQAALLLTYLLEQQQQQQQQAQSAPVFRLGIAGAPGAGKSTFIEAFGQYILNHPRNPALTPTQQSSVNVQAAFEEEEAAAALQKKDNTTTSSNKPNSKSNTSKNAEVLQKTIWYPSKLAVVAVDPSSAVTGGSILGDKTRMQELSRHERAFCRPAPAGSSGSGLAATTDDVMTLCPVAGYDFLILETVGIGQADVEVCETVDMLVLLVPPGGGDDLQGVKKGIVEMADMILVTKADGTFLPNAKITAADYRGAMQFSGRAARSTVGGSYQEELLKRYWYDRPPVLLVSSVSGKGLDKVWEHICRYKTYLTDSNQLWERRLQQRQYWMWKNVQSLVKDMTRHDPSLQPVSQQLQNYMNQGRMTPRVAAKELLKCIVTSGQPKQ